MSRKYIQGVATLHNVSDDNISSYSDAVVTVTDYETGLPTLVYLSESTPTPFIPQTSDSGSFAFWIDFLPANDRIKITFSRSGFPTIQSEPVHPFEVAEQIDGFDAKVTVNATVVSNTGHRNATGNPHSATPGDIGAEPADAAIMKEGENVSLLSNDSDYQTAGDVTITISAHASDSDAHHTKYTDANAVTAMGAKDDSNPLNHDKYLDSEAGSVADGKIATHTALPDAHHTKIHATSHAIAGDDTITPASIGAESQDSTIMKEGENVSLLNNDSDYQSGSEVDGSITTHTSIVDAHHTKYTDAEAITAMGIKSDSNPLNHDKYLDSEAESVVDGKIATHTAIADAHHTKYTDIDAVSAMGTEANNNPLNHDRYLDSEAVAAMSAKANSNPLNHDKYTDSDAISAVGSEFNTNAHRLYDNADNTKKLAHDVADIATGTTRTVKAVDANMKMLTEVDADILTSEGGIQSADALHSHANKEDAFTKNTAFNKDFGSVSDTVCEGDDPRLSDDRDPNSHGASVHIGAIGTASQISDFDTEVSNNTDVAANTSYRGVGHVPLSEKGSANGVAELDGSGTVPISQLPNSVQGGMVVIGIWDANTNNPDLSAMTLYQGQSYQVSVSGNTNLNGETNWKVRDLVIWDDTLIGNWFKLDNTDDVISVHGRTGVVTSVTGDYDASQVDNDSVVTGVTIKDALNTLNSGKEDTFTKSTAFNKDFGSASDTVCEGNDARLSDSRDPNSHSSSHTDGTDDIQDATNLQKGLATASHISDIESANSHISDTVNPHSTDIGNLGVGTLSELNSKVSDATLDDSGDTRDPNSHSSSHTDGTDDIQDATSAQKGLATATQISKLDGIEASADVNNISDVNATDLTDGGETTLHSHADSGGSGDVVGPSSSVDDTIPRYDGTTGKLIKGSDVEIDVNNRMTKIKTLSIDDSSYRTGINLIPKSSLVSAPVIHDMYMDDGTNTKSGEKGLRTYNGTTWEDLPQIREIPIVIKPASQTGPQPAINIPWDCTIVGYRLMADVSGSIVLDLWKDSWVNYPATVADTIVASAKPTLSSAIKSEDYTLTGWSKSLSKGDHLIVNIDSTSTLSYCTLQLRVLIK